MDPNAEKKPKNSADSPSAEQKETTTSDGTYDIETRVHAGKLNAVFENPLADVPKDKLMSDVTEFCEKFNLMEYLESFKKGALVSQNPKAAMELQELNDDDKEALEREHTHKWSQPWALYHLTS